MLKKDISLLFILYFFILGTSAIFLFFIIKILSPDTKELFPAATIALMGIYVIPSYLIYFFPFITFLSSILVLGKLAIENFLLAGVSLGMSAWRICAPFIFVSVFITGFSYFFSIYLGPLGWKKFEKKYEKVKMESIINYGVFHSFENLTFFAERKEGNRLRGVFLHYKEDRKELVLLSEGGHVEEGKIVFEEGSGGMFSKERFYFFEFDEMKFPISIVMEKTKKTFFKKSLSIKELFRYAKELKKARFNPNPVIVEALERLIYPFNTFLFAIFSIPIGFTVIERRFSLSLLTGCVSYLLFFSLYTTFKVLSNKGVINPFIGLPFPTLLLLIFALFFSWVKRRKIYRRG